ncbi:MAG TPA: type II toxin-antitoxin system VapC family toxin [archaeon]|nr:type II toxin-antitoxin system VapC family toxin [archaeon]
MPFGTDFYRAVVLPNITEETRPCKKMDISYLPRGEVKSVYVDASVLLTLLKMESCEHAKNYENVARAFDRLVEEKRTIFISELCAEQTYSSIVSKAQKRRDGPCASLQEYFDLCIGGLDGYKKMKLGKKNLMARKLFEKLYETDVGREFMERVEDDIHAFIARACGDVTIMTYDPAFLGIVRRRLEIKVDGDNMSLQYNSRGETNPLNVISPESFLGIDVPCRKQKAFNTAPQVRSCETPLPELHTI